MTSLFLPEARSGELPLHPFQYMSDVLLSRSKKRETGPMGYTQLQCDVNRRVHRSIHRHLRNRLYVYLYSDCQLTNVESERMIGSCQVGDFRVGNAAASVLRQVGNVECVSFDNADFPSYRVE